MAFLFWRKEESGRVISYLLNKVLQEVNGGGGTERTAVSL